jgi:CBS domain containing-hemolysin-like protein
MELTILAFLILLNGLFAMSEVALLTARRPRLATLAANGDVLAAAAVKLAGEPTRFLSTIQIGITSIGLLNGIVGEAAFAAPTAAWLQSLGLEPKVAEISATALIVISITYVSIVIGELVPKRLGQHNAESIARLVAWPMRGLAVASAPFVHLLAASTDTILKPLLKLLRIRPSESGGQPLSAEEIRTVVLESANFLPRKHVTILLNLFELESITVDDIMVPRSQLEAIDIGADPATLREQLATSYHRRVLVYEEQPDNVVGVLQVRRVLGLAPDEISAARIRELMQPPYFVPSGAPLFSQLAHFQESQERLALVVDEYGELMGLIAMEDILEEIIGEFTTGSPLRAGAFKRQADGSYLVEGATALRELNRKLGCRFPLDGPKTLNGIILEHLQDIPEPDTSLRIAGHTLEIVQTQGRAVRVVRVEPPPAAGTESAGNPR